MAYLSYLRVGFNSVLALTKQLSYCRYQYYFSKIYVAKITSPRGFHASMWFYDQETTLNTKPRFSHKERAQSTLEEFVRNMDLEIRKIRMISNAKVRNIFSEIKKLKPVPILESSYLIRCCGSDMFDTPASERTKLVQEIWDYLKEQGCQFNIYHYNNLLEVHIQNKHAFDAESFLVQMEDQNVKPDWFTYKNIICKYCQDGNIDSAVKFLETMKSKEIVIDEPVLAELIVGYGNAKSMDDVLKVKQFMSELNIPCTKLTYCAIAQSFAVNGDMVSVLSTIQQALDNGHALKPKLLFKIIMALAENKGNIQDIEAVLTKFEYRNKYQFMNASIDLLNRGYHEFAFTVASAMPQCLHADNTLMPRGKFFMAYLMGLSYPSDLIIEYSLKLRELGNKLALLEALGMAFQFRNFDYAVLFLKALHVQKVKLRVHYFWPILLTKKHNFIALVEVLKLMLDLGCPAESETLSWYVFPFVPSDAIDEFRTKLLELGYSEQVVVDSLVNFYIFEVNLSPALELLSLYPNTNVPSLQSLAKAYYKTKDISSVIAILKHVVSYNLKKGIERDACGHLILLYLQYDTNENSDQLEVLLTAINNADLTVSEYLGYEIFRKMDGRLRSNIASLSVVQERETEEVHSNCLNSDLERLDAELMEVRTKGINCLHVLKDLLVVHARKGNRTPVEEILQELEENSFVFDQATLSTLLQHWLKIDHLEKVLQVKKQLTSNFPNFKLDDYQILKLVHLLVKCKLFDEAENEILQHNRRNPLTDSYSTLNKLVFQILATVTSFGEVPILQKIFKLLVENGFCKPNATNLGQLIRVHYIKDDLDAAVEEYARIVEEYNCAPCLNELFKMLSEKKNHGALQRLVQASSRGKVDFNLGCLFLESGDIANARKILRSSRKPADYIVINKCRWYVESSMLSELECLLDLCKGFEYSKCREQMFYQLLRLYSKMNEVDKALELWVKMQEEDIPPTMVTLRFLAKFLISKKQTVPFEVPEGTL